MNNYVSTIKIYHALKKIFKPLTKKKKLDKVISNTLNRLLELIVLNDNKLLDIDKSKDAMISYMKTVLNIKNNDKTLNINMCGYSDKLSLQDIIMNVYCIILENLHNKHNQYLIV